MIEMLRTVQGKRQVPARSRFEQMYHKSVDSAEQAFYAPTNGTNVREWSANMPGLLFVAAWFVFVCLHLVRQQLRGDFR